MGTRNVEYKSFPALDNSDHLVSLVKETRASILSGYENSDKEMVSELIRLKYSFTKITSSIQSVENDPFLKGINDELYSLRDKGTARMNPDPFLNPVIVVLPLEVF